MIIPNQSSSGLFDFCKVLKLIDDNAKDGGPGEV